MRSSVLLRLLVASLGVAACAIGATAYITTRSTTSQLERERSRSLAGDLAVRDQLAAHAALHPTWDGVGPVVDGLAASTGRQITVTAADGSPLADATSGDTPVAVGDPAALVDVLGPLADAASLTPATLTAGTDGQLVVADPLVPAALVDPASPDGVAFAAAAPVAAACVLQPTGGNPAPLWLVSRDAGAPCESAIGAPTGNRYMDLNNALAEDIASCTSARGHETWLAHGTGGVVSVVLADDSGLEAFRTCATSVRTAAFEPLVAPPALVYITGNPAPDPSWLERAGGRRIVLALAAVLGAALLATLLLGGRLLRPIRRMTRATQRMAAAERGTRVRVRGNDEVARLGRSFNAMADAIEAGERQRQQLVSDVAHELRNPLANLSGYLEGAQDGVVAVDRELVDLLLDETVHLRHLVDDLQDVALADAGRLRLHAEPTDVAVTAEQVVVAHAAQARRRGVDLAAAGTSNAIVDGDPVRLRQVLGNLVANALRYTPPGGRIVVDVRHRASDAGREVIVVVADTGVGIEPAHLPHLFDRFYRADTSRTRVTGGSGLGLAICKYLVEAHGGSIGVASRVGSGTAFTIALPAAGDPSADRTARRVGVTPM